MTTIFQKRKKKAAQEHLFRVLSYIDQMEKTGYLFYDSARRMVVIDNDLAMLFIGDERRWSGFMSNLFLWFTFRHAQEQWGRVFRKAEADALKEARTKMAALTKHDVASIREKARNAVAQDAVLPTTDESMTFVVASTRTDDRQDAKAIVVGTYDGHDCRMVPYESEK